VQDLPDEGQRSVEDLVILQAESGRTGENTGNFKGSDVSEGQRNLKENAENV